MKLFRKIRQTLIKEGNLKRYLLYAFGEILLVMIGISLAFQVNNWNDNRIKGNAEIRYYENVRNQIANDRELILEQMNMNKSFMFQFNYANEILEDNNRSKMDTLGLIVRKLTQYTDFDRQGNIYETLVNSGEIKFLRNHDIINGIRLLEEKYLYINRMENIHYDAMMNYVVPGITPLLKFSDGKIQSPDELYTYKFQNLVLALLQIMEEKDKVYQEALNEIEVITAEISEELLS
ncbi:DUF6090 family protein [Flagellimonas flava]|uniref:Four helix bundle sensory module for signal transduction n=1 Tax=Flagellimonas flava TaxID=570519 RepID=A0A1M5HXP2_9FLAO|nr:DUF6090 family protein [Allomuricauda flava]SHG20657.1 hypothetical protein SAMN04488116_0276 [Allomuricauda flava]